MSDEISTNQPRLIYLQSELRERGDTIISRQRNLKRTNIDTHYQRNIEKSGQVKSTVEIPKAFSVALVKLFAQLEYIWVIRRREKKTGCIHISESSEINMVDSSRSLQMSSVVFKKFITKITLQLQYPPKLSFQKRFFHKS